MGGKLEWPWRKDRIYEAERVGHGIPIQCPGCLGNAGCPVVLTAWAGQRLAREEAADKDRSPRSFRKTLPGSTGRREGDGGICSRQHSKMAPKMPAWSRGEYPV